MLMVTHREKKIWGWTRPVFETPYCSVHHLELDAGGFCSIHSHKERANRFIVLSGVVDVVTYIRPWEEHQICIYRLRKGWILDVPSSVIHCFQVAESGEMIEVYYADMGGTVNSEDIERYEPGGLHELNPFANRKPDLGAPS